MCPAQDVRTVGLTLNLSVLHGKTVSCCDITGQRKVKFSTCFLEYSYQHFPNVLSLSFPGKTFFFFWSIKNKIVFASKRHCDETKYPAFTAGRRRGFKMKENSWMDILGGEFVFLRDVGFRDSSPAVCNSSSVVEACDWGSQLFSLAQVAGGPGSKEEVAV